MLINMSSSTLEEYYPAIAIATLMRIIRDPTLSQHHTMVVQVISVEIGFQNVSVYYIRYKLFS
jgi:FKBP12-rapamycin complex-associated protein